MKFKSLALPGALAILSLVAVVLFRDRSNPVGPTTAATNTNPPVKFANSPEIAPAPASVAKSEAVETNQLFRTAKVLWQQPIREEAFAKFHDWADQYTAGDTKARAGLLAEGVELAKTRRSEMAALIKNDPERALELTVPDGVRRELPAEVASLLEARVSGRGNFGVLNALAEPGNESEVRATFRTVTIGDQKYDAYVYGWRLGEPTRNQTPLNGIAVDNTMAVNANSVRILEPEEAAAAKEQVVGEAVCSVSGQATTVVGEEVAADVGGEVTFFCRRLHAEKTNNDINAAQGGGPDPSGGEGSPEASAWTEGLKKVIVIRVDFPDLVGLSLTEAGATTMITNLHTFYQEMSYGRAGFVLIGQGSDVTPIFRMPNPAAYYGTNDFYDALRSDARAAATAAGYTLGNYDRDVICIGSVPGFGWAGLAYVGGAGAWLRNSFGTGVAGHELGHNWGLNHANYWDTGNASTIGPGTSVEYGDSFDTMGSASAGNNHFNARYKNYLNWLTTNEVVTATSNGTYRVYAHDNSSSPGIRGLRIVKNSSTNYWVEFRQKFSSNKWLMSGAGLRWAQNGNQKAQLLDTTPGSTDGKNDACIVIGRTFSDSVSGIHITPIGKGGTTPESLDVVVNVGAFPSNLPPTVDFVASATNAGTGVTLSFTATASDPDADELAYYWDFGDGNFGTNGAVASKSWGTAGEYLVRCVVSDMKGGVASQSLVVQIGSPSTFRISGQITTTNGPQQGVRVYVSTTRMAYTDSDGTYDIVGLPAGTYTVAASLENYAYTPTFVNPVSVGPNKVAMDFSSVYSPPIPITITQQPTNRTILVGTSATFIVGSTGTTPKSYQWRFNGGNISGATASSYTKSNAQLTNAGNYSVVVSNLMGPVTSANAALTVQAPPSITNQPQSQLVTAGTTATLLVAATGTTPLSYQWRFFGTNIPNATAGSYSRVNAQTAHTGGYSVVITNIVGAVTSSVANLTVNYALNASATIGGVVTKSPNQTNYAPGTVVTVTVRPNSTFPFAGWIGNVNSTNNPLTLTVTSNMTLLAQFSSPVSEIIVDNPQASFFGTWTTATSAGNKYGADYRTAASTAGGSATAMATFRPNITTGGRYDVYGWTPTITSPSTVPVLVSTVDSDLTVNVNQSVNTGSWQLIAAGKLFAAGSNGFVRIDNVGGQSKNVAADAVRFIYAADQNYQTPYITAQPTNTVVVPGGAANFNVTAGGTGPLAYQWRRNGGNLANATNTSLAIPNAQAANEGSYTVVISNAIATTTSVVATLIVAEPPQVLNPPQPQRVIEGFPASFDVSVSGTAPFAYQWRRDAATIVGATEATYTISPAHAGDAGSYDVKVSNAGGSVTSAPAALVIRVRPHFSGLVFSNGLSLLTLSGTADDVYEVETSSNSSDWTLSATVTNVTGSVPYADETSGDAVLRFYRARLVP